MYQTCRVNIRYMSELFDVKLMQLILFQYQKKQLQMYIKHCLLNF